MRTIFTKLLLLTVLTVSTWTTRTSAQNPNTELKQTTTTNSLPFLLGCAVVSGTTWSSSGDNHFGRVFNLGTLNTNSHDSFIFRNIKFGVVEAYNTGAAATTINVTVNIYRVNGTYTIANRTLLTSATYPITVQPFTYIFNQLYTVPIVQRVGANQNIAIEVSTPDLSGTNNSYIAIRSYSGAETAPGYWHANACALTNPMTLVSQWGVPLANLGYIGPSVNLEANGEFFTLPAQPGNFTVKKDTICAGKVGNTYTIPAVPGATSYTWSYTGGGVTINGTGTTVTLDASLAATSGRLEVQANNYYGAGPIRSMNIEVSATANIQITPNNPMICIGDSVVLTGPPGFVSYAWEPPTGLSSLTTQATTAKPINSHSYTLLVETSGGCTGVGSVFVTVNQGPNLVINPDPLMVCGDSLEINLSGATRYAWSPTTGLDNPTSGNLKAKPNVTTNYTITATDTATGCSNTNSATITVNNFNAAITANGRILSATPNMASYLWYKDGEIIVPHSIFYQHNAKSNGMYKAFVTSPNGCSGFTSEIPVTALSINTLGDNTVKIFPNPSKSTINIECDFEVNYRLYSIDGKLVATGEKSKTVDISKFTAGMYQLVVEEASTKASASFKIIKSE